MRKIFGLVLLVTSYLFSFAQSVEKNYPKTLKVSADSFLVKFSSYPEIIPMKFGKRDTVDMGTDGTLGMTATIYYDKDSITIPYKNLPYAQVDYIPIQSPNRRVIYRLHFNGVNAYFPPSYIEKNSGNVQFEIPEVYELANIIWTLSPSGQRAKDLYKSGPYFEKVSAYFKPYLNHAIFKQLDFPDSLYFKNYYDFRENSFAFQFKGDKLVWEGPYYYVMGDDWDDYTSLFRKLAPLAEDFARKSNFRQFYKNNKPYYQQQINRASTLMPIKNMWQWLENEFPKPKYQSYKVAFSPLIGGSHSTQNFWTESFGETVMFICGTDRYDSIPSLNDKQRQGLMSGVVFTEIDHNYVNPASNKYASSIDSIFSKRSTWTADDNNWYGSPMAVFNEYMTHAVFCLWVLDNFDQATADYVIERRESLMVDRRHFNRFKEFDRALINLRKKDKTQKVVSMYPAILDWCRTQL